MTGRLVTKNPILARDLAAADCGSIKYHLLCENNAEAGRRSDSEHWRTVQMATNDR